MQTGENILDKLTKLQHLYRDGGNNEVVSLTLDKILAYEIEITEKDTAKFREKLEHYERQYQMSSEDFYALFEKGELGNEMDFFEWGVYYDMWLSMQERVTIPNR